MRSKSVREQDETKRRRKKKKKKRKKTQRVTKSNNVQHILAIPFPLWLSSFWAANIHTHTHTHTQSRARSKLCTDITMVLKMISWVCIFIKNFMFYILRLCNLVKSLSLVIPNGILCIVFLVSMYTAFVCLHTVAYNTLDFVGMFACFIYAPHRNGIISHCNRFFWRRIQINAQQNIRSTEFHFQCDSFLFAQIPRNVRYWIWRAKNRFN